MNDELRRELVAMSTRDSLKRQSLIDSNDVFDGYSTEMEELHRENALRLEQIVVKYGWPGILLVGEDGSEAAWLVAQHAISMPELQRHFLRMIQDAVAREDAPQRHEAYLLDRILFNRDQPQLYGLVFDWNVEGELSAWIDQDDLADQRRRELGLPSVEEATRQARLEAEREGHRPPEDIDEYHRNRRRWAREVGWIEDS